MVLMKVYGCYLICYCLALILFCFAEELSVYVTNRDEKVEEKALETMKSVVEKNGLMESAQHFKISPLCSYTS